MLKTRIEIQILRFMNETVIIDFRALRGNEAAAVRGGPATTRTCAPDREP